MDSGRALRDFWKTGKAGFALFLISLFVLIYGSIPSIMRSREAGKDTYRFKMS